MYGEVHISVHRDHPMLTVPTAAMLFEANGTQLAVVDDDNHVHFRKVTVGQDLGQRLEVVGGVSADEKVITNPGEKLTEGAIVEIAGEAQPSAPAIAGARTTRQPAAAHHAVCPDRFRSARCRWIRRHGPVSPRSVNALISIRRCSRGVFLASLLALAGCPTQQEEIQSYRKVVDAGLPRPMSYQPGEPLSLEPGHDAGESGQRADRPAGRELCAGDDRQEPRRRGIFANRFVSTGFHDRTSRPKTAPPPPAPSVTPQVAATSGGYVIRGDTWQRFEAPVNGGMNLSFVSYPNLRSTEQTIIQQRQLLLDTQATLLLNVAQTYYQVLLSEEQVRVLENSLKVQNARLADAQSRFENHLALRAGSLPDARPGRLHRSPC